jgi:hypothetical protein
VKAEEVGAVAVLEVEDFAEEVVSEDKSFFEHFLIIYLIIRSLEANSSGILRKRKSLT